MMNSVVASVLIAALALHCAFVPYMVYDVIRRQRPPAGQTARALPWWQGVLTWPSYVILPLLGEFVWLQLRRLPPSEAPTTASKTRG